MVVLPLIVAPGKAEVVLAESLLVVPPAPFVDEPFSVVGGPAEAVEEPGLDVEVVLTGVVCELESGPVIAFAIATSNW